MGLLEGRTALITGAARGIGYGIASSFVREGANVVVVDLDLTASEEAARSLANASIRTLGLAGDAGDEKQVQTVVAAAQNTFGRIDILVNNAGIDTVSELAQMSTQMWDDMMRVNVKSVFLCCRAVLPLMIENRYGRIINISSQLAHKGTPGMAHYCASKAAILGFTRALAHEVISSGVTVNAICPGPIDTEMFRSQPEQWRRQKLAELPIGRMGSINEVAPSAVLLASDAGSFYVGASLNPNGGDVMI